MVVKRSTGLKELSKTVSNNSLGTSSVSISTTSSSDALPPSYFIDNDSVKFCEKIGNYETVPCPIRYTPSSLARFFDLNENKNVEMYVNLDRTPNAQKGTGWKFNVYPGDWSNIVPGAPTKGYLFIYFQQSFERSDCGYIADKQAGGVCSAIYNNETEVINTNQGEIFAVVISNISQINALNRTLAVQTGGNFLSNAINNAKGFKFRLAGGLTGYFVDYFIDNISKNFTDKTPILSFAGIYVPSPLILQNTNTDTIYCPQNALLNLYYSNWWYASDISNPTNTPQQLTQSQVAKLTLGFFSIDSPNAAIVGKETIQVLNSGTFTVRFQTKYFEDTENISINPNGPSFYGPGFVTLTINAIVTPLTLKFNDSTIPIELLKDGGIKKIDLSELIRDLILSNKIDIKNIDIKDLQYKIESIPTAQSNYTTTTTSSSNSTFLNISSSFGEGGCKLTVSYINNNDKYSYSTSTSVNLSWKFKVTELFFTLAKSNPLVSIPFFSQVTVELPLRLHVQESNINAYVYPSIKLIPPYYVSDVSYFYFYSTDGDYSIYRDVTFSIENLQGNAYINYSVGFDIEVYSPFSPGKCNLIANYKGQIFKLELNWNVKDEITKTLVILLRRTV